MSKPALLARPHTFIVAEMKPFLEDLGLLPSAVKGTSGAVISLAIAARLIQRHFRCVQFS